MRTIHALLILLAVFLIAIPIAIWISIPAPVETIALDVHLKVGDIPAFALTDEPILRLGTIPPRQKGERGFNLTNNHPFSVNAVIDYDGDEWIYLSEKEFTLQRGEVRDVMVYASVPEDAEYGEYNWNLIIRLYKEP
jgi:hypothetical protein